LEKKTDPPNHDRAGRTNQKRKKTRHSVGGFLEKGAGGVPGVKFQKVTTKKGKEKEHGAQDAIGEKTTGTSSNRRSYPKGGKGAGGTPGHKGHSKKEGSRKAPNSSNTTLKVERGGGEAKRKEKKTR